MRKRLKKKNENIIKVTKKMKYSLLICVALFAIWAIISLIFSDMGFSNLWNKEEAPFIYFHLNRVISPGVWGGLSLFIALITLIGSFYLIFTKKAAEPKKLAVIAPLFALMFFGFASLCLGLGWSDDVLDSKDYEQYGAKEKVIVLEDYQEIIPSGMYGGATDYVYISNDGERFSTNTNFTMDVYKGEKYKVRYLPRSKYVIGIDQINNGEN
ncbi:hypothetical protein [Robertmurraya kyonggiensis]|uniref:Uncharacterized protein n=1 Tax=Robertmurraya kyonggiensis TaxID=1037680 RepID=A0A4U1D378_9BACI|nr:hypothetical protein [Robertmurraya kyonggiensis]TKC16183.1 hypothetical protein FA727_14600 [Robertmurraya kyonggiensis]